MLVSMEIAKYQWNAMVAEETYELDDSSFRRIIFSLVNTQTRDMGFQLEVQTSIQEVTAKVKIKATLNSLGGRFESICTQWKVVGKIDKQVLEIF